MKAVIFDFNRTLYDPLTQGLVPGAEQLLEELKAKGVTMFLVSYAEGKKDLITSLGIEKYFKEVVLTSDKSLKDFRYLVQKYDIDSKGSVVVGDRIKGEITYGNQLGMTTIWFKTGVFASELPEGEGEKPNFEVMSLKAVSDVVIGLF